MAKDIRGRDAQSVISFFGTAWGVFTLSEGLHNKHEVDEAKEEYLELIKPSEDSPEGFQTKHRRLPIRIA